MRLLLTLALIALTSPASINANYSISSYDTLVPNVTYTINIVYGPSSLSIPSGSYFVIQFSQHFIINSSNVNSCLYLVTGSAYLNATCSIAFNINTGFNEITIQGMYVSASTNQAGISLMVSHFLFSSI
jgi:hypothetical protein